MHHRLRLLIISCALAVPVVNRSVFADETADDDPCRAVDTLVGTGRYTGATFPGAARPFSLLRLGPDTPEASTAGYNPSQPILGFSHTHMSGAGGVAYYGNIRVTPQIGPISLTDLASPKRDEHGEPGYYSVLLTRSDIRAELTTTSRVGFHRYTFPSGAVPRILIDVSASTGDIARAKYQCHCTAASATYISDRAVEGHASFIADFAKIPYDVYFVAEFDRPCLHCRTWRGSDIFNGAKPVDSSKGESTGAIVEFDPKDRRPVELRVGISFHSMQIARQSLADTERETFDRARAEAAAEWRADLNRIVVTGGTPIQHRQFYTALYQTALMPTDVTGDDPAWPTKEPHFTDIHAVWDTFRATYPLFTLIRPEEERRIIRFLLDIYSQKGWLPDYWRLDRFNNVQGGTNADVVIADAIVKNLGGFDRDLAYLAVKKDATVPSPAKQYPSFGRFAPYFTLGYVPGTNLDPKHGCEYTNATSATLEYAYDDFCVAEVATSLGHTEDAKAFRMRSLGVYTLFDPEHKFFWSKNAAGDWLPGFRPDLNGPQPHGWQTPFYEATPWVYRFYVPHDVRGLINHLGGNSEFVAAMDEYFDGKHHDAGNEPSFLTPWLYNYTGRPDKTVDRVRAILATDYHFTPDAYAGDDDSGSMSAWYVFAAMGFYPNAGQDVYLIASPIFSKVKVMLGSSGKSFTISAVDLTPENKYVQCALLNGKPLDRSWFRHGEIIDGAELTLTMGPQPSAWGTKDPPPSSSDSFETH